jgi:hypothetical protein
MEISLINRFGWSLRDIDETDIESLLPFINRLNSAGEPGEPGTRKAYADEVDFL